VPEITLDTQVSVRPKSTGSDAVSEPKPEIREPEKPADCSSKSSKSSKSSTSDKKRHNNNNNNNNDDEDVTVLPSDYLFNRFSYSNLLTQGHLYFRSWDELQYQVLGSLPEAPNPILSGGPPELLHHLPRMQPHDRMTSSEEGRCVSFNFYLPYRP
jgi:hypothetical protein